MRMDEAIRQLCFEDLEVGAALPVLVKRPTAVQLFRFSAATWNAHRIHFDAEYARTEGYPNVLVQSHLHGSFLAQAVTVWAGPAGRLRRIRWENRRPAVPGDVLTCSGVVTGLRIEDSAHLVECGLEERNQNGELCAPAWATVELPSRRESNR